MGEDASQGLAVTAEAEVAQEVAEKSSESAQPALHLVPSPPAVVEIQQFSPERRALIAALNGVGADISPLLWADDK